MSFSFPQFITVGFVGVRHLMREGESRSLEEIEARLKQRLKEVLDLLEGQLPTNGRLAAVSALAVGADTLFAEVVAERGIAHQVFLPQPPDTFFDLRDFFDSPEALERSRRCLSTPNVINIQVASNSPGRRTRFSECAYEIVSECDVLIATVHENELGSPGGSMETLLYAEKAGRRVFRIAPTEDAPVTETPAAGGSGVGAIDAEVASWPIEVHPGSALPAVEALKKYASQLASKERRLFRYAAGMIVITHVAATAVAGWSLSGLWAGEQLTLFKAVFLCLGLGVYFYLHFYHPQRSWVIGRLVAELTRSVIALHGLKVRLGYLRDFHLTGCNRLVRALNTLHLQDSWPAAISLSEFAHGYVEKRLNTQIDYYERHAKSARRWRRVLDGLFLAFSFMALGAVVVYWFLHPAKDTLGPWQRMFFLFVPVAFPMIAAAAASWISLLDLDRRVERYEGMVQFLVERKAEITRALSPGMLSRAVQRIEHALLQEVSEWHAKQSHMRGH